MPPRKEIDKYNIDIEKFILAFEEDYSRKDMAEMFELTEMRVRTLWKKLGLTRKGKPRSKRHSEKISKAAKERYENGFKAWNTGTPWDDATKKKISESKKGTKPWNYGMSWSQEVKEKIGQKNRGRKHTPEARRKQLENTPRGERHHNWRGGITTINQSVRKMPEYIEWRNKVFMQDNWACCSCGAKGSMNVDHIKPFSFIMRENNIQSREEAKNCDELWDIENGRTLCVPCHRETETYGGRSK
jgi:5-methylcytosine-specific restriction endonuclease McrA